MSKARRFARWVPKVVMICLTASAAVHAQIDFTQNLGKAPAMSYDTSRFQNACKNSISTTLRKLDRWDTQFADSLDVGGPSNGKMPVRGSVTYKVWNKNDTQTVSTAFSCSVDQKTAEVLEISFGVPALNRALLCQRRIEMQVAEQEKRTKTVTITASSLGDEPVSRGRYRLTGTGVWTTNNDERSSFEFRCDFKDDEIVKANYTFPIQVHGRIARGPDTK